MPRVRKRLNDPTPNYRHCQLRFDHGLIGLGCLGVAGGDRPELLEALEAVFDDGAAPVGALIDGGLLASFHSAASPGYYERHPLNSQRCLDVADTGLEQELLSCGGPAEAVPTTLEVRRACGPATDFALPPSPAARSRTRGPR